MKLNKWNQTNETKQVKLNNKQPGLQSRPPATLPPHNRNHTPSTSTRTSTSNTDPQLQLAILLNEALALPLQPANAVLQFKNIVASLFEDIGLALLVVLHLLPAAAAAAAAAAVADIAAGGATAGGAICRVAVEVVLVVAGEQRLARVVVAGRHKLQKGVHAALDAFAPLLLAVEVVAAALLVLAEFFVGLRVASGVDRVDRVEMAHSEMCVGGMVVVVVGMVGIVGMVNPRERRWECGC